MRLVVVAGIILLAGVGDAFAQGAASSTLGKAKSVAANSSPKKSPPADPKATPAASPVEAPKVPITTEIYADEANFDNAKYIGVFGGHVVVNDPRFNVQCEKLTIYVSKGPNEGGGQGLEKAIAEGNVGVVRDRPSEDGSPPTRAVGRADKAIYTTKDGNVELSGNPRVQQGVNTHVSTSPETVMILNEKGQLQTHGPSRTEIRQEPKPEASPKP